MTSESILSASHVWGSGVNRMGGRVSWGGLEQMFIGGDEGSFGVYIIDRKVDVVLNMCVNELEI